MAKRAIFSVTVAGTNISTALLPVLTSLTVSDKVGTHSDTANLEVDDTDGRIVLPQVGAPVVIALGWADQGMRPVFEGTVDEVKSSGSRGGGRSLSIAAKGVDTTRMPKQGQQRHFDNSTVKDILTKAGQLVGITQFEIDPALASIVRTYFDMRDESFIHMGERLAREIGANFRVQGTKAIISQRAGPYTAAVRAAWGENLHSWDISPSLGRGRFGKARARAYDMKEARLITEEIATGLPADATHARRELEASVEDARRAIRADAATTKQAAGGGTVVIEGNTEAIPDGLCIVAGARPGVDGAYRIKSVTHNYSRGGGFVTSLELIEPQSGVGTDTR
jgi:uncharacterized protein